MKKSLLLLVVFFLGMMFFPNASHAYNPPKQEMDAPDVFTVDKNTENDKCTYCHGVKGFSTLKSEGEKLKSNRQNLHVDMETFNKSVHGKRLCVECHADITKVPHVEGEKHKVNCVQCHEDLFAKRTVPRAKGEEALDRVVENITQFMDSIHAKPNKKDPSRPNAYCSDCHNGHEIFAKGSAERKEFHMKSPLICGQCHEKQLGVYENSLHGKAVLRWGDDAKPVCADCHTPHQISAAKTSNAQVIITQNCGTCHKEQYNTYINTYHGQVNKLGYANTAKCFDCHESHDNKRITDPASKVHMDNREKTCKACHKNVSEGFLTFQPHGSTQNFDKYPEMWLTSKGMIGLLVGVFAVFWTHSMLWFWRERKEKKAGIHHKPPKEVEETPLPATGERINVQRFPAMWRVAHISFALSIMVLGATGLTVLFASSFWAKTMARMLGGPENMAIIHRFAAVVFVGVFFIHLVYVLHKLLIKNRKTFQWFGPYSLVPRWQDLWDLIAMLKWFAGKGPRPHFDHWTYWEKFDYWAPFWGVSIIGGSGLVLWYPGFAGQYLPGWIFNVATIFHGEEAVLAIIFLFSVHFFNCHLRPSKFPLDIIMFTGNMPMEEFKEQRTVEFQRMAAEGKLAEVMVKPATDKFQFYAKILGFTLLAVGLTLLFLALSGLLTEIIHFLA
ncbi:MAG: cytochrome c3 family protein [Magnetococcus sp. YQC-5]